MPPPRNHLRILIVIPARYQSTRLPGKPLIDLCGQSMIRRTYMNCILALNKTNIVTTRTPDHIEGKVTVVPLDEIGRRQRGATEACFLHVAGSDKADDCRDRQGGEPLPNVYVATDDERIQEHCKKNNMNVIMTSQNCITGTDRVCEFSEKIDADIYINVQGDEPLLDPKDIEAVIEASKGNPQHIISAMHPLHNEDEYRSLSTTKVVTTLNNELLYASRAPIPSNKFSSFSMAKKHIGIFAFPKQALSDFAHVTTKTPLEEKEDIEILRFLELGHPVRMVELLRPSLSVDTPEDIKKVEEILRAASN